MDWGFRRSNGKGFWLGMRAKVWARALGLGLGQG